MSSSGRASRSATMSPFSASRISKARRSRHGARIGPFARLRPGAEIGADAHIGNFVEIKKAKIGAGRQGQSSRLYRRCERGRETNIGAGTITCNYDGFEKHLHRDRRRCLRRLEHGAGGAGQDRRWCEYRGRAASSPAMSRPMRSPSRAASSRSRDGWAPKYREHQEGQEARKALGAEHVRHRRHSGQRAGGARHRSAALKRLEYRGYDSAGIATIENGNGRAACARRASSAISRTKLERSRSQGHDGHRPHALGDAWRAQRDQRASACRGRCRHRPQRHHREFPGAEGRAPRARASSSRRRPTPKSSPI